MTSSADSNAAFHLFPNLPPELRLQIWQDALPDQAGPGLYNYRPACWEPSTVPQRHYLALEFRHDRLGRTVLDTPLTSVSREARDVALAWAAEQDAVEILRVMRRESSSSSTCGRGPLPPLLVRRFDPRCDVLYVSLDDWHRFYTEPHDRAFEPDMIGRDHAVASQVTRVAVPEAFIREWGYYRHYFQEMFNPWQSIWQRLYIILDPQPDGFLPAGGALAGTEDTDHIILPRWEIDEKPVVELVWLSDKDQWTVSEYENGCVDEWLFALLASAAGELQQWLKYFRSEMGQNQLDPWKFEIRAVSVHRGG